MQCKWVVDIVPKINLPTTGFGCGMWIQVPIHQNLWLLGRCGQTAGKWLTPTKNKDYGKEQGEELDLIVNEEKQPLLTVQLMQSGGLHLLFCIFLLC